MSNTIKVTVNSHSGIINSTAPVVLKNTPTIINVPLTRLADLLDVSATAVANGDTLVYDDTTHKYIVEKLDLINTIGTLDGGEF